MKNLNKRLEKFKHSYGPQKFASSILCCVALVYNSVFLILDNLDGKKSFGVDKLHPFLSSVGAFQTFVL